MNLRELTKRYGRGIGLSLSAVRLYAHQMLVGLYHLRACGVIHADIKPDNILCVGWGEGTGFVCATVWREPSLPSTNGVKGRYLLTPGLSRTPCAGSTRGARRSSSATLGPRCFPGTMRSRRTSSRGSTGPRRSSWVCPTVRACGEEVGLAPASLRSLAVWFSQCHSSAVHAPPAALAVQFYPPTIPSPPKLYHPVPADHPLDMWGVGCVVYELFTGHILFPGKTNNEMLKLMMDVKGAFPRKMLRRAEFAFRHFESDALMSFTLVEEDPVTRRPTRRVIPNPTVRKDVAALLAGQAPDQRAKLAQLVDLLERMLALDPDKRITPREALRHPFICEPIAG